MDTQANLWQGRPSHIINLPLYSLCILFSWLILPLFYALWQALIIQCNQYELDAGRLRLHAGVLHRYQYDVELYRVITYYTERPFWMLFFGLSNVHISTSDPNNPNITLKAIGNADRVCHLLRQYKEQSKLRHNTGELNVHRL